MSRPGRPQGEYLRAQPEGAPASRRAWHWLAAAVAAAVLAAVFAAYLNPHLAVDLAGRVWAACGF